MSKEYTVEKFNSSNFNYQDALDAAWIQYHGFNESNFGRYIYGSKYRYEDLPSLKKSIRDPRSRLNRIFTQSRDHVRAINHFARFYHTELMNLGREVYFLRDPEGRPCGMGYWQYPDYMVESYKKENGLLNNLALDLKRVFFTVYYKAVDLVEQIVYGEHVFFNKRLFRFMEEHSSAHKSKALSVDELSKLSPKELETANYPVSSMVYCFMFTILPDYQRKGLGQVLMNSCISSVPESKPTFGEVEGPQKLNLWATDEGKGMYEKCGWVPLERYALIDHGNNGKEVATTDMVIIR